MHDETITLPRPVDPARADDGDDSTGRLAGGDAARRALSAAQDLRERVARVLGSVQLRDAQNQGGQ